MLFTSLYERDILYFFLLLASYLPPSGPSRPQNNSPFSFNPCAHTTITIQPMKRIQSYFVDRTKAHCYTELAWPLVFLSFCNRMQFALLLASVLPAMALAFQSPSIYYCMHRPPPRPSLRFSAPNDDKEGGGTNQSTKYSELDDLTPPTISFTRNSILFGDNPPTQKNNGPLWLWRSAKTILPPMVTGAYGNKDRGDTRPVEHLYNLIFVRTPTVLAACLYVKNIVLGHPLVVNFGDGTMIEVSPLIVFGVIFAILGGGKNSSH